MVKIRPKAVIQSAVIGTVLLILSLDYFFANATIGYLATKAKQMVVPIASFALVASVMTLYTRHLKSAIRREKNMPYDLVVILFLTITIVAGFFFTSAFTWINNNWGLPLSIGINAFYALFAVSAMYRAFRLRSIEAGLLLLGAGITLLMQAPVAAASIAAIPVLGTWLLNVPTMAGLRGLAIAVGIGTFAVAVRMLLGYEKSVSE